MGLIRTFQGAKVIKRLSLIENVMLARQSNPGDRLLNFPRFLTRKKFEAETRDLAMSYLSTVGLTPLADEFAGVLSGGQRKLLDLARSLMAKPKLLMLDEPFAGVNPKLRDTLLEILVKMKSENKIPLVLVEHDLDTVKQISNKVIVLAQGSVIAQGGPEHIFNDQKVIDAYIGTRRHGDAR
jgi:ABC-type branched-subunit amino acid transport system ATPase component